MEDCGSFSSYSPSEMFEGSDDFSPEKMKSLKTKNNFGSSGSGGQVKGYLNES